MTAKLTQRSPGEKLPSFPAKTHSKSPTTPGLPRWIGAGEAIDRIPAETTHHSPRTMPRVQGAGWDRTKPFHTIMTVKDSKCVHYSGERGLTIRELATIQGFPYRHEFPHDLPESKIQKQIGNAVPASFMKLLYGEVIKTLREADGRGMEDGRTRNSAYEVS